jgi:hypothetical protein
VAPDASIFPPTMTAQSSAEQSSDEQAPALRYDSDDPCDFFGHDLPNPSSAISPTPSLSLHPSPDPHASSAPTVPKFRSEFKKAGAST